LNTVVENMLKKTYSAALSLYPNTVDSEIEKTIAEFKTVFSKMPEQEKVNYETNLANFVYIYRYFPFRCSGLSDILNKAKLPKKITSEKVNVMSLGGGPGTEVVSILEHLELPEREKVSFRIYDYHKEWEECINCIRENYSADIEICNHDFLVDHLGDEHFVKVKVYTLSYFLSELFWRNENRFYEILNELFKKAEPGAIFIIFDLFNKGIKDGVDFCITDAGLQTLVAGDGDLYFSHSNDLHGEFKDRFKDNLGACWTAQKSGNSMWWALRK
jgi:hypothetical protein